MHQSRREVGHAFGLNVGKLFEELGANYGEFYRSVLQYKDKV
jgi:hypothetical protein